ncbi:MAG: pantoate--beta-alanine ligase [Phycisphaerales bacterium]
MQVIETYQQMREWSSATRTTQDRIGFVPTQGCLHKGHAHLLNTARPQSDTLVLSIFVNPLQFRRAAFDAYPRRLKEDLRLAESCGVDVVFAPTIESVYPETESLDHLMSAQDIDPDARPLEQFKLESINDNCPFEYVRVPTKLTSPMDGKHHPWHFDGVATVVRRLFNSVQPHAAYFGEKDIQQLAILQAMNEWLAHTQLGHHTTIVPVEIVRDRDGLSSSSRLVLLNKQQRSIAVELTKQITDLADTIQYAGFNVSDAVEQLRESLGRIERNGHRFEIDTVDIVDPKTLAPITMGSTQAVIYIAYLIDGIRLAETRWCCACKGSKKTRK